MGSTVPEKIGRYKVLSVLGQGGMGIVYLAEDMRLKRKVAVKVIRKDARDNEFDNTLERFNREAEISARLNHPNIITVFDVGEDPEAGVFLAMEFVQGQSLAAFLQGNRPSPEAGLMLLVQAMRALEAAGREGILHRDIKPENMLVSQSGRLKLMDFGLARGDDSRITATGVMVGTPSFSAPELIQGKEPSLDTDRYAFFVTAFEVMVGGLPFGGRTIGVTLYNIIHEPPVFPSDVSPDLKRVFEKALAKDSATRYPNLTQFLVDLVQASPLQPSVQARILAKLEPSGEDDALSPSPLPEIRSETPIPGGNTVQLPSKPPSPTSAPSPSPTPSRHATPQPTPTHSLLPKIVLPPPPKPSSPAKNARQGTPPLSMDKLLKGLKPPAHSPLPHPTKPERLPISRKPAPRPTRESVPKPPRAALGAPGGAPQERRDEHSGSTRFEPDAVGDCPPPQPEGTAPGGRSAASAPLTDEPHGPAGPSFSVSPEAIRETNRHLRSIPPDVVAARGGFGTDSSANPVDPVPPPPALQEPISTFLATGDPFEGVDWEAILSNSEPVAGPNAMEDLLRDLEAGIHDADVLLAENQAEEAELQEDLRSLESGIRKLNPADLLAAEDRAEAADRKLG